jgi:phosphoribosylaminoimidazolecarboxamide formyltransferase/IMP cyclohydrolase
VQVHGGILGVRGNEKHAADMSSAGIEPIDLVVVNLYAFEAVRICSLPIPTNRTVSRLLQTVAKGADFDTCIENIDIGGPSMIRSAAKNNAAVVISVSPSQYGELRSELAANKYVAVRCRAPRVHGARCALQGLYHPCAAAAFCRGCLCTHGRV